ncbi:MAG: hypothetical protein M3Y26_06730 [Actinomycetota bacterium]|nr:hypothetical protein [Actinomycetota bacterium]
MSVENNVDEARLRATTDAGVWADEFAKVQPDADWGLMVGWFANAIQAGLTAAGGVAGDS